MAHGNGFLTTHILDTANGCPAHGVRIELFRLQGDERQLINAMVTNDDGRTDEPILGKGALEIGTYELVFEIGDYFAGSGEKPAHPFVDVVPIRFGISDADQHYHVPLLASPFSYSTYRGS
mgnify:CR=1 FL=1